MATVSITSDLKTKKEGSDARYAKSNKTYRDEKDGVNYVYAPGTVPTYEVQDIAWMNDELNKGSAGMRLMLPSIGTLMMTTYGYANINQELKKLLPKNIIPAYDGLSFRS